MIRRFPCTVYPCVTYSSKMAKKHLMNGQMSYPVSVLKSLKTVFPNTHPYLQFCFGSTLVHKYYMENSRSQYFTHVKS